MRNTWRASQKAEKNEKKRRKREEEKLAEDTHKGSAQRIGFIAYLSIVCTIAKARIADGYIFTFQLIFCESA
jgi:hypothetical protein